MTMEGALTRLNAVPPSFNSTPEVPILIRHATILTMDEAVPDLERDDILIRGRNIDAIGPALDSEPDAIVIDGSHRIVLPGFVDCHRHAWMGGLRSVHPDSSSLAEAFEAGLQGFGSYYRPQDVYAGTVATAVTSLDSGITTVVDNMHCNLSPAHGDASIQAWADTGMEALVALEYGGFAPPEPPLEEIVNGIREARESIGNAKSRVEVGIFGHYFNSEYSAAEQLDCRIVQELLPDQQEALLANYEAGHLNERVTLNHCSGLSDEAWQAIKDSGASVNISPRSDAQWSLGGGFNGYQDARSMDILPGISIDNEISYGGDMFREMSTLFAMQRAQISSGISSGSPMRVRDLLRAATIDGARCAGRENAIGSLKPGKLANMIIINADDLNLYPAFTAAGAAALASDRSNVETVIVQGRILKLEGELLHVDLENYRGIIRESVEYLKDAAGYVSSNITEEFHLA